MFVSERNMYVKFTIQSKYIPYMFIIFFTEVILYYYHSKYLFHIILLSLTHMIFLVYLCNNYIIIQFKYIQITSVIFNLTIQIYFHCTSTIIMYKRSRYVHRRVYIHPSDTTEVDPGEFTCSLQVVLNKTRESLPFIKIERFYNHSPIYNRLVAYDTILQVLL